MTVPNSFGPLISAAMLTWDLLSVANSKLAAWPPRLDLITTRPPAVPWGPAACAPSASRAWPATRSLRRAWRPRRGRTARGGLGLGLTTSSSTRPDSAWTAAASSRHFAAQRLVLGLGGRTQLVDRSAQPARGAAQLVEQFTESARVGTGA